jgi:DNA-binding XRE family transcriptional regulator
MLLVEHQAIEKGTYKPLISICRTHSCSMTGIAALSLNIYLCGKVFYNLSLPKSRVSFFSHTVKTVELLDGSFYSMERQHSLMYSLETSFCWWIFLDGLVLHQED